MQALRRGKIPQLMALLLICMALGATLVCQVHATSAEHEHAVPDKGHAHPSAHSGLDLSCMLAVLPTVVILALFRFQISYVILLTLKTTAVVLPPFIPPRHLAS